MTIAEDLVELVPGNSCLLLDGSNSYWIKDGEVFFGNYVCKGADPKTFRFYRGGFGKDSKHAYCSMTRLRGANGATFYALNFTYYTDGNRFWTLGGEIKDADPETFQVCDDGVKMDATGTVRFYYGFARDKANVYYYGSQGKTKIVKKADVASFESLNDGHFGKDAHNVFFGVYSLPKVDLATWHKLGATFYTRDDKRVYYANTLLTSVDYDTFEVMKTTQNLPVAKDKHRFYYAHSELDKKQFDDFLA